VAPTPGGATAWVQALATTPRVPLPTDPVDAPSDLSYTRYFPATHHTLREPFLSFWTRHGDIPVFGYPITEPFLEGGQTVQYFERARLVYSGGQVSVSPLGLAVTAGRHFPRVPSTSDASRFYYASSGHTLAAPFLAYWQAHQGSEIIGPPISEPLREQNGDGTGRVYLVQYFRNMRLEYHPELKGTPYVVQPGLLGRQYLHQRGWI
jgi:hypothetical protein